jgi:UDP-N-acetylmuramate: L-alanyl-gamma-D-glutamyl-meso-diaminopimelate ligase
VGGVETSEEGTRFRLLHEGEDAGEVRFPWTGDYAVRNALAAWAACRRLGVEEDAIRSALASFPGVKRRMEIRGEEDGVSVVDDFAHHPTAIREVIAGARVRFAGRRLWVAFEPRSWSCRRRLHQEAFPGAMAGADRVLIGAVYGGERLEASERLDTAAVASALAERDVEARAVATNDEVLAVLLEETRPGDVVLALSNGSFDGLHGRLLEGLREREKGRCG